MFKKLEEKGEEKEEYYFLYLTLMGKIWLVTNKVALIIHCSKHNNPLQIIAVPNGRDYMKSHDR